VGLVGLIALFVAGAALALLLICLLAAGLYLRNTTKTPKGKVEKVMPGETEDEISVVPTAPVAIRTLGFSTTNDKATRPTASQLIRQLEVADLQQDACNRLKLMAIADLLPHIARLLQLLQHETKAVRNLAADVLAGRGVDFMREHVIPLTESAEAQYQAACLLVLSKLPPRQLAHHEDSLSKCLRMGDAETRKSAIHVMAGLPEARLGAHMTVLVRCLKDSSKIVQHAAVAVIIQAPTSLVRPQQAELVALERSTNKAAADGARQVLQKLTDDVEFSGLWARKRPPGFLASGS